jgi:hypothetical protein
MREVGYYLPLPTKRVYRRVYLASTIDLAYDITTMDNFGLQYDDTYSFHFRGGIILTDEHVSGFKTSSD